MKLLSLVETVEESTVRRSLEIVAGAVRGCNSAIKQIKDLAIDRGGKNLFLVELGDKSSGIVSACKDLKILVEKLSDLNGENL